MNNGKLSAPAQSNSPEEQLTALYHELLKREPDPDGLKHWAQAIRHGTSLAEVRDTIKASLEYLAKQVSANTPPALVALHHARVAMVKQLPKAKKILDLGGGAINEPRGALIVMGYPYAFEQLHILEPPPDARHEIYRYIPDVVNTVETEQGPVYYHYGSMADLSRFEDASFDLVISGETIEHVTVEDCKKTLAEVRRVLTPEGSFCFDTPNREVTQFHFPDGYINPEHKIEYRHREMLVLLHEAKLEPIEMKGITFMPETVKRKQFVEREMLDNRGMYADLEQCYMLYYRCVRRQPLTALVRTEWNRRVRINIEK